MSSDDSGAARAAAPARLTVDLGALLANHALLVRAAAPAAVAGVLKADAYGLGAAAVARALAGAGCREFFVACPAEGGALRAALPDAAIHVLGGLARDNLAQYLRLRLIPVLNTVEEAELWVAHAHGAAAALHVDTGMNRVGLDATDVERLVAQPALLAALRPSLLVTHLACADEPGHASIERQLERYAALRARLPPMRTSIGNSAGTLLGPATRGDLVRAGIALYGGNPFATGANPMREVVRLEARIVQLRDIADEATVGYGATHRVRPPARIATLALGYADGYPRALGGRGLASIAGRRVPVVGRVSMDYVTIDVTALPRAALAVGDYATLLGDGLALDEIAALAGTISYELLTRIGARVARRYL